MALRRVAPGGARPHPIAGTGPSWHDAGVRRALLLLVVSLLAVAAAGPATAAERLGERAGELQLAADRALRSGDSRLAASLAAQALALDGGPASWLAWQVRIDALERMGRLGAALDAAKEYLALDGLFPEHRAWGIEARGRLRSHLGDVRASRRVVGGEPERRRGAGVVLVLTALAPLGVGVASVANFVHQGNDVEISGGWLDLGAPLIVAGAAVEIAGIVLLASSGPAPPRSAAILLPVPGGLVLAGRFP